MRKKTFAEKETGIMCECEQVTGCWVCSSVLSEHILSAGSESPPWTDPLVSYRQRTVIIHMCTRLHTQSSTQWNINTTESAKKDTTDKNHGFHIIFCYLGSGELWKKMTQAAEGEIRGRSWAKYWPQSFKTNSLCGKDWQITKHTHSHWKGRRECRGSRLWGFSVMQVMVI